MKSLSKLHSPCACGWLPPASWWHSSCSVPWRVGDAGCCRAPCKVCPTWCVPSSDRTSCAAEPCSGRTMPGKQSPGRHTAVTAGGYFFNVSVTHACVCFSTESHLRPELALHSVQPVLGYERTVVEGNFLWDHPSCGVSERREKSNKWQAEELQGWT